MTRYLITMKGVATLGLLRYLDNLAQQALKAADDGILDSAELDKLKLNRSAVSKLEKMGMIIKETK